MIEAPYLDDTSRFFLNPNFTSITYCGQGETGGAKGSFWTNYAHPLGATAGDKARYNNSVLLQALAAWASTNTTHVSLWTYATQFENFMVPYPTWGGMGFGVMTHFASLFANSATKGFFGEGTQV